MVEGAHALAAAPAPRRRSCWPQPHPRCPLPTGTIDLLAYTDKENEVPLGWEESDPRYIANAADVKLRAFSTKARRRREGQGWGEGSCRLHTSVVAATLAAAAQRKAPCPDRTVAPGAPPLLQVHNVEALVSYKTEDDLLY